MSTEARAGVRRSVAARPVAARPVAARPVAARPVAARPVAARARTLAVILMLTAAVPVWAQGGRSVEEAGMELTRVSSQLRLLHGAWQSWTQAYYKKDREAAADASERLQSIVRFLGMSHLPDLAIATATFAVRSAREGDIERARWVLEDARALDPGRPEVDFAAATVLRLSGDWIGAALSAARGWVCLLRLPRERGIWLHNVGLWALAVVLISGCVLVALELAVRGSALCRNFLEVIPPSIPQPLVMPTLVVALLWPLLLPAGLLWLVLYWSVLLWGYGSTSEKTVLLALWLLLGVTPLALSYQQSRLQMALIPPTRALDHLAADRLYGGLFSDLGVLRTMLPDHPAVLELIADLHRRFDQWDQARPLYNRLATDRDRGASSTAAPLNNLGLYHFHHKDYGTAVDYFQRATEADPSSAAAFFNLSRAYSRMFAFRPSNDALDRANELDRGLVDRWSEAEKDSDETGIGIDGGLAQAAQIREALRSAWQTSDHPVSLVDLWRRHLSLSIAAAVIVLALVLHMVRRQLGLSAAPHDTPRNAVGSGWLEVWVPGLRSLHRGHGGRALLDVAVVVGLATLVWFAGRGYRLPLGYDPGHWFVVTAGVVALVLWLAVRCGWLLMAEGAR